MNQNVSRFQRVAVSVGAVPHAQRIVENQAVIVLTVVPPCSIETMKGWLFVTFATVKVMAVPEAFPDTMCILLAEQSRATVWAPVAGVYMAPVISWALRTGFPVNTGETRFAYIVSKYVFRNAFTFVQVVRIRLNAFAESCPVISSASTRLVFAAVQ